MADVARAILGAQDRIANRPPFIVSIRLCCSRGAKEAWLEWFNAELGDGLIFGSQIHWYDWDEPEVSFPKPGFLVFYSDNSMSWTELNNKQQVPALIDPAT